MQSILPKAARAIQELLEHAKDFLVVSPGMPSQLAESFLKMPS